MGIDNLNKNLEYHNLLISNSKSNLYIYQNLVTYFGDQLLNNILIHVDFSLLVYKIVFTSKSYKEFYNRIKSFILDLKKNNAICLYIDPKQNLRKIHTHVYRLKYKKAEIQKNKLIIKQKGIIDTNNILFLNDNDLPNIQYDKYESTVIHNFDYLNLENVYQESDREICFKLFIRSYPFKYHIRYILQSLLKENILSQGEILYSNYLDAELEIIHNIKTHFAKHKNVIFTIDQDFILFSTLHLNNKFIFLSNFSLNIYELKLLYNCFISKNISMLTCFFNKSDYFPGIKFFMFDSKKTDFIIENEIIFNKNFKIKELVKLFIINYVIIFKNKKKINSEMTNLSYQYIDKYFDNFELYFNLEYEFYQKSVNLIQITITDLIDYFNYN